MRRNRPLRPLWPRGISLLTADPGRMPARGETIAPMASKVPVIGLFAGAGGLEIGAHWAGADVRLSVDHDPVACETLRLNPGLHPGVVLEADVSQLDGKTLRKRAGLSRREACVVIGGPPCQPF